VSTDDRSLSGKNPGKTTSIVGYTRVSTDEQGEFGVSLALQKAQIEAFADVRGRELVAFETDTLSAKSLERPGLRRALAMLLAGKADVLVVTKLDRLTRSVRDGEDLLDAYFRGHDRLVSLGDPVDLKTATGVWLFRVLVSMGAHERERTGERTRDGLAHKRKTGGGTPQVSPAAAARIAELDAGGASLRVICKRLTKEGIATTKGGRWAPETVRKVLARAR